MKEGQVVETKTETVILSGTVKSGNTRYITPREAKREYDRAWRKANPEKVKAAKERYYQRLADKMNAERNAHEE